MRVLMLSVLLIVFFTYESKAQTLKGLLRRTIERKVIETIDKKVDKTIDGVITKDSNISRESPGVVGSKKGLSKIVSNVKPNEYYKFFSSIESVMSTKRNKKAKPLKTKQKSYLNPDLPAIGMRYEVLGSPPKQGEESFMILDYSKSTIFNFSKFDDVRMVLPIDIEVVTNVISGKTPNDKVLHWKKMPETKTIAGLLCDRYLVELSNGVMYLYISRIEIDEFKDYVYAMRRTSKNPNNGWGIFMSLKRHHRAPFKDGQMVMAYEWFGSSGSQTNMLITKLNKEDHYEFAAHEYIKN